MMTKDGSTKIVNFMTPGAGVLVLVCGHTSNIVKINYFFKRSFSLLSQALNRQTKYIVMMTKEGSTKIVNFIYVIIMNMYYLLLYEYTSH